MIVLYGATGYTGRLVAAELAATSESLLVAGRNETKLVSLAQELQTRYPTCRIKWRACAGNDRAGLHALITEAAAVVSAAGPFAEIGLPLVETCADAGIPYCDTTGEPGFVHSVREHFPDSEAPIVPACGFDYVPHGLAAALAAQQVDTVNRVDTALLARHFAMSRGTKRSLLAAASDSQLVFTDGRWHTEPPVALTRIFQYPPPAGPLEAVSYAGGDAVQIANHIKTARTVRSWIVTPRIVARTARPMTQVLSAVTDLPGARGFLDEALRRSSEGPSIKKRTRATFAVLVEVVGTDAAARVLASGTDIYGTTAIMTARIASQLATGIGTKGKAFPGGFRSPAEIVGDPLDFATDCGLTLELV